MKQRQLDRAVAHATGESLSTVRCMGFSIFEPDNLIRKQEIIFGPPPKGGGDWAFSLGIPRRRHAFDHKMNMRARSGLCVERTTAASHARKSCPSVHVRVMVRT